MGRVPDWEFWSTAGACLRKWFLRYVLQARGGDHSTAPLYPPHLLKPYREAFVADKQRELSARLHALGPTVSRAARAKPEEVEKVFTRTLEHCFACGFYELCWGGTAPKPPKRAVYKWAPALRLKPK